MFTMIATPAQATTALPHVHPAPRARPITAIQPIATAWGKFVQPDVLLLLVRTSACCRCFCKIGSVLPASRGCLLGDSLFASHALYMPG